MAYVSTYFHVHIDLHTSRVLELFYEELGGYVFVQNLKI